MESSTVFVNENKIYRTQHKIARAETEKHYL